VNSTNAGPALQIEKDGFPMRKTRWFFMVAFAVAALAAFSGCNTVRGMGKDLERGGQRLQEVSDR